MTEWSEKVAVVTGGANGIGLSLARRCVSQGMQVVLADCDVDALDAAVAAFEADGAIAIGVPTDVSLVDEVDRLAAIVHERFGPVAVLVNNAGVQTYGYTAWDTPAATWQWMVEVNLLGVVHAVRAFLPRMLDAGEGHVVNMGSIASLQAKPLGSAYAACKHALLGYSEALQYELAELGSSVRVSIVLPRNTHGTTMRRAADRWPERLGPVAAAGPAGMRHAGPVSPDSGALSTEDVADATWRALETGRFLVPVGFGLEQMSTRLNEMEGIDAPYREYWSADRERDVLPPD